MLQYVTCLYRWREQVREQKLAKQELRKTASRLGRDVKIFWQQVGKLCVYKHQMQVCLCTYMESAILVWGGLCRRPC